MLAKVSSFGILGIEAYPVEIEIDISFGLPAISLIGLPDLTIRESKERLKPAIKNSGFRWPPERITVSLAPSDVKKEGASFDLAVALGILAASAQLDGERLREYVILGELSLDGEVRPIKGILPRVMGMSKFNKKKIIVPFDNRKEASLIPGIKVFPVHTVKETVQFLYDTELIKAFTANLNGLISSAPVPGLDFAEVKGQSLAKRALDVDVC